ncbi:MAG: MlrC C-terminal domain-containing protein, partial [Betaproteobacteria bacterium]|nr:MlrC C-terminal domain-containing protein [Betaproteobacteria bacterium]
FAQPLLDPDEAVRQAMKISAKATKPVVIADTQDNAGGGGTGDTPGMLEALVRSHAETAALCVLTDAKAAAAAHAAGEGADITIELGGCTPLPNVKPFRGTFRVTRLSDGRFMCKGLCVGGREAKLGPTALLTIGGVSIVVASKRMQAYDLEILRHIGVEPTEQKILVVKSTPARTWSMRASIRTSICAPACGWSRWARRSCRARRKTRHVYFLRALMNFPLATPSPKLLHA